MSNFLKWQQVSVFISSTFMDMVAERDYLNRIVLPRLNDYFASKRILVNMIDLRWGINTIDEASAQEREGHILKVCFDEISRSKPFFVALLGDRYGWVPSESQYQELVATVPDFAAHRLDYCEGASVTAMEIFYGALGSWELLSRSLFYFREADYSQLSATKKALFVEQSEDSQEKIRKLKEQIKHRCQEEGSPQSVSEYHVSSWNGTSFVDLDAWGEKIYSDLVREISEECLGSDTSRPEADDEEAILASFIYNTTRCFQGRKDTMAWLHAQQDNHRVNMLVAPSGYGKSAVLCKFYQDICDEETDAIVLFHSAGVSSRSKRVEQMLLRWMAQIESQLGRDFVGRICRDDNGLEFGSICNQFSDLTSEIIKIGGRLIIMVDAIDQFPSSDFAKFLTYIPHGVTAFFSCVPEELKRVKFVANSNIRELGAFGREEAQETLRIRHKNNHHSLYREVEEAILSKKEGKGYAYQSPLWVNLVADMLLSLDGDDYAQLEEMKVVSDDEKKERYQLELIKKIPNNPGQLFLFQVERAAKSFGQNLTQTTLLLLALSRNGFREQDLAALLRHGWDGLRFARLRRWFKSFIFEVGPEKRWAISHKILKDAVLSKQSSSEIRQLHEMIAHYCLNQLCVDNSFRIEEGMYHIRQGRNCNQAMEFIVSATEHDQVQPGFAYLKEAMLEEGECGNNTTAKWIVVLCGERFQIDNRFSLLEKMFHDFENVILSDVRIAKQHLLVTEAMIKGFTAIRHRHPMIDAYIAAVHSNRGKIYYSLNQNRKAIDAYTESYELSRVLFKKMPNEQDVRLGYISTMENLIRLYRLMGKQSKIDLLNRELNAINAGCGIPYDGGWGGYDVSVEETNMAMSLAFQADDLAYQGGYQEAIPLYRQSIDMFIQSQGDGDVWVEDELLYLCNVYNNLAFTYLRAGIYFMADRTLKEAEPKMNLLLNQYPNSPSTRRSLAYYYLHYSDYHRVSGHLKWTDEYKEQALQVYPEITTELPNVKNNAK